MITASTFGWPSASAARLATRLESTPPLRPSTNRSKPTLRTSLRMNPIRMRLTSSGLMTSGAKPGSEWLAVARMPDSPQSLDGQFQPFVAQQGIRQPLPPHLGQVEAGEDEGLVRVFLLGDDVAVRANHHRSAPELGPVLEADPIAVEKEGRQELGVAAADQVIRLRRPQPLVGRDPPPRARRRTDDHVDAFETQDVRAGEMPDVLADQYPGPTEPGPEAAKAIARCEVALFIEHPVGRQVDLAVEVYQLATAEIKAGVEIAVIGLFDDRPHNDVQVGRQGAELAHDRVIEPDRAVRDEILEEIPGQAQLGEHQQVRAGGGRLAHPLAVPLQVTVA